MPTKKQAIDSTKQSTIIFDETHTFGDRQVHFVIDILNVQSDLAEYSTRLRKHRKIKGESDFDFLDYNDPVVRVAEENFSDIEDDTERMEMALDMAKDHYRELASVADNDAVILAITIDNDFSDIEVEQYEDSSEQRILPGLGKPLPLPKRDIRFSTEKRLAQLYQVLSRDVEKWQSLRSRIVVQFSMAMKKYGGSRLDGSTF